MARSSRERLPSHTHAGMTVIELMVTLAILVVTMAIAVPGLSGLIAENRRVASINQLLGTLNMLRNEAIKRGIRITLCKTSSTEAVLVMCDPDAGWAEGWAIFVDNTHQPGNVLGVIDGTDTLLRAMKPDREIVIATGANYARGIFYEPSGVSRGINATGNATLGNDTFRVTSGGDRLCVTVNGTGRPSVRRPGQSGCL